MPNPYSITVDQYAGRALSAHGMIPAYSLEEAERIYGEKVGFWEKETLAPGIAINITLICNDPKYVVQEKTLKG
jgi:hypothetical protein